MDYSYALRVFAYPLLEVLAIVVYATGPHRTESRFTIRSVFLTVLLVGSIVASVRYPFSDGERHFFPGLGLDYLVCGHISALHAVIVCLLGILELIRLGRPKNRAKT